MANQQPSAEKLYNLLPAIYRERDAELGEPLRALLDIVQQQADLVEADIEQLWNNFFIETCEPWAIPYLGDLVGTSPLFDSSRIRQPDTAGDLYPDLAGPGLIPEVAARSRADVAKTIYYRRRKGTLPMLEELARDVTGWGAHAVEFFELLIWSQAVRNHVKLQRTATPDLRKVEPADRLNGPFDSIAHSVDVRPISQLDGWYRPKNIGFFLWRLGSYESERVQARRVGPAGDYRYHFSPLGNAAPLFSRWRREGDEAGLATEFHVPGPVRPAAFYEDLRSYLDSGTAEGFSEFYGLFDSLTDPAANPSGLPEAPQGASLMIFRDSVAVRPERVRCMDLSTWRQPSGQVVGVDVRLGRMAFGDAWVPAEGVDAFYHYGFSANLGGGPYRRSAWAIRPGLASAPPIEVEQSGQTPNAATSINQALTRWQDAGRPNAVIRILDSRTYQEAIAIEPAPGRWLAIEAADGVRPHLLLDGPLQVSGALADEADSPESSLTLSGLLIEGWVHVSGSLGRLRLLHSTLVPGRALGQGGCPLTAEPSLLVEGGADDELINKFLRVEIAFSITGPLRIPAHAQGLWMLDSILDAQLGTVEQGLFDCAESGFESGVALSAPEQASSPPLSPPELEFPPAPPAWLERVTVLGSSFVKELTMASESIFSQPVFAQRQQAGCVRFCYVAPGSQTPRRFRCQPDLEIAARQQKAEEEADPAGPPFGQPQKDAIRAEVERWLSPVFTSDNYGQPAYAQLHLACPVQIFKGAEDGSEMGAFSHLKQPQREANLRLRLEEYLPFGLNAGIIYVT